MLVAVVCIVATGAMTFSFRPDMAGRAAMWTGLLVPYALLSLVGVWRMHRDEALGIRFRVKSGDITIGGAIAGALLLCAWGTKAVLFDGMDAPNAWLLRLVLQIGPFGGTLVPLAIAAMAIMEEVVWRGLVLDGLGEHLGTRRAWLPAALLYAAVHLPTAITLADPDLGPNPLLPAAALGAGVVWSLAATRLGRLPPIILSHLIFTYFAPALMIPNLAE